MKKHLCPVPLRREKRVVELLTGLGFSVSLPTIPRPAMRVPALKRKQITSEVPLLSGYVLILGEHRPELYRALIQAGVIRRGKRFEITDVDIERMQKANADTIERAKPKAWRPGDKAKIVNGPLSGKAVVVKAIRGARAETIFEGRKINVNIAALEAA